MEMDNELLRGPVRRVVTETQYSDGRTRRVETILDGKGRTLKTMVRYESGSEWTYSAEAEDAPASQHNVKRLDGGGFVKVESVEHANSWETPLGYHQGIGTYGASVARTYFSEQMRPLMTVLETPEAEEVSRIHYRYDDDTNTMEFVETGGLVYRKRDGSLRLNVSDDGTGQVLEDAEGFRATFRRDPQNRLIECTTSFGGSTLGRATYARNELGEVTTWKGWSFELETGESQESTVLFEYKYDDRNNWVEKKRMSTEGTCLTTTRREIEYADAAGQISENSEDVTQ